MDARVVRTREALRSALFELIQEKRWEKITVQDLLDRTGISRSTFYAHYINKFDVLTKEIPDVAALIEVDPDTSNVDVRLLFEHVDEMAAIFAPLLSQAVLGEIWAVLEKGFVEVFERVVVPGSSPTLPRFLGGALLATMREYVIKGRRPPAAEVAAEVGGFLNQLLDWQD
ncbi:MAG: TetR family transcriptional regulator [Actinomycetia bacterium]|nr:TetR family transcriptional regulator [Actinomycetes bacterium]MCP4961347.1 TetR family transcriptional regulator [Actinomycetes bacterium]